MYFAHSNLKGNKRFSIVVSTVFHTGLANENTLPPFPTLTLGGLSTGVKNSHQTQTCKLLLWVPFDNEFILNLRNFLKSINILYKISQINEYLKEIKRRK